MRLDCACPAVLAVNSMGVAGSAVRADFQGLVVHRMTGDVGFLRGWANKVQSLGKFNF